MKTKMVDVYDVVGSRRQAVGDVLDIIHQRPYLRPEFITGDVVGSTATISQVPVHCYRFSDGREVYLAVAPELRELIESYLTRPLREELASLHAARYREAHALHQAQYRIESFETMPWWRRVLVALEGRLPRSAA